MDTLELAYSSALNSLIRVLTDNQLSLFDKQANRNNGSLSYSLTDTDQLSYDFTFTEQDFSQFRVVLNKINVLAVLLKETE